MINEEVQRLLEANIIRVSESPWSAPVVPIKKPDGSTRMCVDYRKLNKVTDKSNFPIPRQDDIFDRLSKSKIFSTFDLKSGFHQMPMDKESISKTAFSTTDGHYEFLRMPMGVANGPAEFSKAMQAKFGNEPNVEVYIDDLVVHSNSFTEHLIHLKRIFSILSKNNLKINRKKCTWAKSEIKLLGHIISDKSIKMDIAKIEKVKNWKIPTKVVHIQQFIGLAGYYRRFIKDFSSIAAPLYNLLKKDVKFNWCNDCQAAFDQL
jgi:hypothetical protein